MLMSKDKALCLIPARGGSKRIPRKNIKPFLGSPIIDYAINTAACFSGFDKIVVSTDDQEIADYITKSNKAEVPFIRPKDISDDITPLYEVILHAYNFYMSKGVRYENICCILPTAVFTKYTDLRLAKVLVDSPKGRAVAASVIEVDRIAHRYLKMSEDGSLKMLSEEHRLTRTSDLPPLYKDAGQFYWINMNKFLAGGCQLFSKDTVGVCLNKAIDIDTEDDWAVAEAYLKAVEDD